MLRFCCLSCTSYFYFHFSLHVKKNVSGWDGFQSQFCALASNSCLRLSAFGLACCPCFEQARACHCSLLLHPCQLWSCGLSERKLVRSDTICRGRSWVSPVPSPLRGAAFWCPVGACDGLAVGDSLRSAALFCTVERWTGAGGLAAFSSLVVSFQISKLSVPAPAEFSCWPSPAEHKHANVNPELALLPINSLLCFQVKLFFFFAHLCMSVHNAACFCMVKQGTSLPLLLHSEDFICMWCLMNLIS